VVRVRIYDDRLEVFYGQKLQLTIERLSGRQAHRIDYRHIIDSLVRKPGAFRLYKYREDLFPTLVFRRAYDALCEASSEWPADVSYLQILRLAASTLESEVEAALELLLDEGQAPRFEKVEALVRLEAVEVPLLAVPEVDLHAYDQLLSMEETAS
jgi:hypothetical protein